MGLQGLAQFNKNLLAMMDSKAFKEADDGKRLNMGYRLINSKYGGVYGGKVAPLVVPKCKVA